MECTSLWSALWSVRHCGVYFTVECTSLWSALWSVRHCGVYFTVECTVECTSLWSVRHCGLYVTQSTLHHSHVYCTARTPDQSAGGVFIDPGYVDNGTGLVGIPAHTGGAGQAGTR